MSLGHTIEECLGVKQHGMSAASVQEQWLVIANLIEIGLSDMLLVLHPSSSQVELALRIFCYKFLDNLAVSVVVSQGSSLHQISLSDKAVAGQMAVNFPIKKNHGSCLEP